MIDLFFAPANLSQSAHSVAEKSLCSGLSRVLHARLKILWGRRLRPRGGRAMANRQIARGAKRRPRGP